MLPEVVAGGTAKEVGTRDKDELLEEIGIALTAVRLKCALLGLTTLKVALHKGKGTPLPEGLAGFDELELKQCSRRPWVACICRRSGALPRERLVSERRRWNRRSSRRLRCGRHYDKRP